MEIHFADDSSIAEETVNITTNPVKKPLWGSMNNALLALNKTITVIDAKTNRNVLIALNEVMVIESEGRMCNIKIRTGELYLLNMRLKAFEDESNYAGHSRINNQVIINVNMIDSFRAAENARLEVVMKDQSIYFVNRYYVKLFKEKLK